jgi:hypothetical protein
MTSLFIPGTDERIFVQREAASFAKHEESRKVLFNNVCRGTKRLKPITRNIPNAFNFDNRISRSTVSKVFLKSKNTTALTLSQSILYTQLFCQQVLDQ